MNNLNEWIQSNKDKIDHLIRQFEEYDMMGSYGGNINFKIAIFLFRGAIHEIKRLEEEKNKYEKYKKDELDELKNTVQLQLETIYKLKDELKSKE